MSYSFDGVNKRIVLGSGVTTLNLVDMYSRWKDWARDGNAGFLPAFIAVGGDIPAIPLYLFLINGWRIVPQTADHVLTVVAGVLEVQGGGDPFVDPVGSYKIRINRESPGIAIGYSSNGSAITASEIASAVWQHSSATQIATWMREAWARLGLDPAKPVQVGDASITFGDVVCAVVETTSTTTVTRL